MRYPTKKETVRKKIIALLSVLLVVLVSLTAISALAATNDTQDIGRRNSATGTTKVTSQGAAGVLWAKEVKRETSEKLYEKLLPDRKLNAGNDVSGDIIEYSYYTEEEEIYFDTLYEETYDLYDDQEEVLVEGYNGSKTVTYEVTTINGEVTNVEAVSEEVTVEAVDTVIQIGLTPRPEPEPECESEAVEEYEEESSSSGVSYTKQAIVDAALAQLGVHQDCTMLVTNSLRAVGIDFHSGPQGYTSLGTWTDYPEPGDICIYTSHVAIYIGDGQAVHGGWYGYTTEVWSVYTSWPQFIGYIHLDL